MGVGGNEEEGGCVSGGRSVGLLRGSGQGRDDAATPEGAVGDRAVGKEEPPHE